MSGTALAAAARTLVGVRFRLHGRDPATGLDCIGLLEAALAAIDRPARLPNGYALRLSRIEQWLPSPGDLGFESISGPALAGDVMLVAPSPGQVHLAIALGSGGWVHAHAGLHRVVETPDRPEGQVLHHWRLLPR